MEKLSLPCGLGLKRPFPEFLFPPDPQEGGREPLVPEDVVAVY